MFTASMGIGMVAPILPLHARAMGASGAEVGLTFSAFAITQILVSPFAGRLADRFGRKRFILAGIATYVVAALGWYATASVESVIALRALTVVDAGHEGRPSDIVAAWRIIIARSIMRTVNNHAHA